MDKVQKSCNVLIVGTGEKCKCIYPIQNVPRIAKRFVLSHTLKIDTDDDFEQKLIHMADDDSVSFTFLNEFNLRSEVKIFKYNDNTLIRNTYDFVKAFTYKANPKLYNLLYDDDEEKEYPRVSMFDFPKEFHSLFETDDTMVGDIDKGSIIRLL